MTFVDCEIVRWVSDEPHPGLVEAHLVDTTGRIWKFVDKAPIFSLDNLASSTRYPVRGAIRCAIVSELSTPNESATVVVDTATPDGVYTVTGEHQFSMLAAQIHQ